MTINNILFLFKNNISKRKAFFLIVFSLVVLFWTNNGDIINGNDTTYPLKPVQFFKQRLFMWNHSIGGGIDFSHASAGLTWHGMQALPSIFGLPLELSQKIFLFVFFNFIVFSFYFFISQLIPKNFWSRLTGVIIYVFNPYLFNLWGNIQAGNLCAYVLIPLGSGFLIKSLKEKNNLFFNSVLFGIISILFSAFAMNPQVVAVTFLYFVLFLVFLWHGFVFKTKTVSLMKFLEIVVVFLFAYITFNLFWIVPEAKAILGNNVSIGIPTGSSLRGWLDFVSANTGVNNVLRMQGEWMWYKTLNDLPYIPFAGIYKDNPFLIFLSFFPFAAALGALFKSKKNWVVFYGVLLLIGLFFSVGIKPPFGYLYLFLTDKLKLFSFLRSPWYKFSLLTLIAYGTLASLLVDSFKSKKGIIVAVILIFGQLVYSYPIITGEIFPVKSALPYKYAIPEYIYYSDNLLREDLQEGKIVMLPRQGDLDYYAWGGNSSTQFLNLLANPKPILTEPSWTVAGDTNINEIVRAFYDYFDNSWSKDALKIVAPLNVKYLLHKTDYDYKSDKKLENPTEVEEKISKLNFLKPVSPIGLWRFYEIKPELIKPFIYAANQIDIVEAPPYLLADYLMVKPSVDSVTVSSKSLAFQNQNKNFNFKNYAIGILRKKIENLTPPPAYIRFSPESFFYPLIRSKEEKKLSSIVDPADKLGEKIFYCAKRINEIKIVIDRNKKNKNALVDKLLADYLILSREIENEFRRLNINDFNFKIKNIQLIDYYCRENLSKLNNFGETDFYLNLARAIGSTENICLFASNLLDDSISSPTIKKFSVSLPRTGKYKMKFLLKNKPSVTENYIVDKISINGNEIKANSGLKDKNILTFSGIDFVSLNNKVIVHLANPYGGNPALVIEEENETIIDKPILPGIEYTKIDPTKYIVNVDEAGENFLLVFTENFHSGWKATVNSKSVKKTLSESVHIKVNDFANGWIIGEKGDFQVILEYSPQNIYTKFLYFTAVVLILGVIYLVIYYLKIIHVKT